MTIDRNRLKEQYKELYTEIQCILFSIDPVGVNYGDNIDEYNAEVDTILPRLESAATAEDVLNIVHEELSNWFGDAMVGDISEPKYAQIADEVWSAWVAYKS